MTLSSENAHHLLSRNTRRNLFDARTLQGPPKLFYHTHVSQQYSPHGGQQNKLLTIIMQQPVRPDIVAHCPRSIGTIRIRMYYFSVSPDIPTSPQAIVVLLKRIAPSAVHSFQYTTISITEERRFPWPSHFINLNLFYFPGIFLFWTIMF